MDYEQYYYLWKKKPTKNNLNILLKKYSGILHRELPKYKGNLPLGILKSYGKKFMLDAFKTYNPKKGKLANHIAINLQRLHRVNYETSGTLRMSEELQSGVNLYKTAYNSLLNKYMREPTIEELSDKLNWSKSKVIRTKNALRKEIAHSTLEVAPATIQTQDPIIDYIYEDLSPEEKIVFQYRTGYNNSPILNISKIAKKVKLSPSKISKMALGIAKKITNEINKQKSYARI